MTLETLFFSTLPFPKELQPPTTTTPNPSQNSNIPALPVAEEENLLLCYIIQLYSVLSKLHSSNFDLYASNLLHPSKILTNPLRAKKIFLNCGGIPDILSFWLLSQQQNKTSTQQDLKIFPQNETERDARVKNDWKKLGIMILGLAVRDYNGAKTNPAAILEKV